MSNHLFRKKPLTHILKELNAQGGGHELKRDLNVRDLTYMGIAAVVGAGIFSTIGAAAYNGGPGVAFLFIITAVTCGFAALCYAEFASRIPISGSAYTYAYVSFGEVIAWIIGWALILEYAIGNIVVAISWSSYFDHLLKGLNIHLPGWLLFDPTTAKSAYQTAQTALAAGETLTPDMQFAVATWNSAPLLGSWRLFLNIPAAIIVVLITLLVYIGIRESKKSTNAMVIFKLAVIGLVIVLGFFYVDTQNWNPFMPNGFTGVLKGVSAVFYAYIGFDAISTTAEECENPQRDLPRGMIYSLIICTVLYILIALVLTGMVSYQELNVTDPLAYVFERINVPWISYVIALSAVVATTTVLLVFQLGQPRIWMSMSRDGLLPKSFARIHPKFKTPSFATMVTGLIVAIPSLFMDPKLVTDLTSIGTLFAFVLVSGGVLFLPQDDGTTRRFRLPYVNGKYIVPFLFVVFLGLFRQRVISLPQALTHNMQEFLFLVFLILAIIITYYTFRRNYSLIPILGVLFCSYLLIEIPAVSWLWFFVWMAIGLMIYYSYGYRHSRLRSANG